MNVQADSEDQRRQAKLGILTSNGPALRKPERECCAMLDEVGVHHYRGTECGKHCKERWLLAVIDQGDFGIITSVPAQSGEKQTI